MFRHKTDDHGGDEIEWQMKVLNKFPKQPLDRIVEESQNINRREKELSLNSKTEYAKSSIIQVSFTSDNRQEKEDKMKAKATLQKERDRLLQYRQKDIPEVTRNTTMNTPKHRNNTFNYPTNTTQTPSVKSLVTLYNAMDNKSQNTPNKKPPNMLDYFKYKHKKPPNSD